MGSTARRDIIFSLTFGVICLLFFHLDHLVVTYSGWNDPSWLLHVVVDSGYVWVYAALAWVGLRGWRVWKRREGEDKERGKE